MIERPVSLPVPGDPYVPERCRRSPNSSFDRAFGIYVCNQRDARCCFHGPVFIQDDSGRHYECRARDGVA